MGFYAWHKIPNFTPMTTLHIWNTFEQRLHAFILQKVRDGDVAGDILQDVFEKIHRKIDTLQAEKKLESWLFAITRNSINDHFRKQKLHEEIVEDQVSDVEYDAGKYDDLIDCLSPFLKKLPSPYKEVLHDYQFLKIPQKDIARNRNAAYSTIRSQVKRARDMLYDQFMSCCRKQITSRDEACPSEKKEAACCN
jgi:RNA polymerase sigma-70 factor (ECF subfamily)